MTPQQAAQMIATLQLIALLLGAAPTDLPTTEDPGNGNPPKPPGSN